MILLSLRPCRNYLHELIAPDKWSAKYTITQLIKSIPAFLDKYSKLPKKELRIPAPIFCEYFEINTIFSWKFCQVYPVQLCKGEKMKEGVLAVSMLLSEVMAFEKVNGE